MERRARSRRRDRNRPRGGIHAVAAPEPPSGQPGMLDSLRDRLRGLLGPSQPANEDDCTGYWRICHFL